MKLKNVLSSSITFGFGTAFDCLEVTGVRRLSRNARLPLRRLASPNAGGPPHWIDHEIQQVCELLMSMKKELLALSRCQNWIPKVII